MDEQAETPETPNKASQLIAQMQAEQNLPMAIVGGIIAAIVGAVIWAAITVATEYQIGWMAIGVGFLVGFAVRFTGKGLTNIHGVIGAALSLVGCILGNFFSLVGFISIQEQIGFFDVLRLMDYAVLPEVMMSTFVPMDLLFYGLALYQGYKFSFRQLSEEEFKQIEDPA